MRIIGIIFTFALVIPFLLPQKGEGISSLHQDATSIEAAGIDAPNRLEEVQKISFTSKRDLESLISALNVLGDEINTEDGVCLTQAIYFEARSEPVEGQLAVAQVVLNRVNDPRYPSTICDVVYQNEKLRYRCQFSFACDGLSETAYNPAAWDTALRISYLALSGRWEDITDQATHYHASYVNPSWSHNLMPTAHLGTHIFYRTSDSAS